MGRSSGEGYRAFRGIAGLVTRRHKALLALWILLFVGALVANQVWRSEDVITFYQSATLPEDTESAKAQEIIDAQFPGQTANSSATVVLVAANATVNPYRQFAIDLHDAIVAASTLPNGQTVTLRLQTGANLTIDEPIQFLRDPRNATIYAVYESYAYALAVQFNDAVHGQVLFTETAAGIYWGLPAYFLGVWENATLLGDPDPNGTAYAATQAYYAPFPPAGPWANASFNAFYPGWQASFSNGSMDSFPPSLRAETVIGQTLPAFLSSPFAIAAFDANERLFQLGMLAVFRLSNFANPAVIEPYALAVFPPIGVAELPFLEDILRDLPPNATDAQLRSFARAEVLRYDVDTTPLTLPLDVARFFLSPNRRLLLMNYGFDRDAEYVDAAHRKPVAETVGVIRDLVARIRTEYESAGFAGAVYVTGSAPLSVDQEFLLGGGAEFGVTILLVIILIGLYFRSAVSPAFPILTIAIAIMISNLFVYFIAVYVLSLHFTVTAVLQTVLLATGTDYSIFLISRFRDERQDGREKKEAVRNAVVWAGESVATSGGAVLIAFAALSLGSFPILKGMGITIGFAVTIAIGIALTFIPAVLMVLGDRVFWPSGKRVAAVRPKGQRTASERYFHGAADFSMRHAKVIVLVAILVTIPSVYLVFTDEPSFDLAEGVPPTESSRGLDAISASFGQGFFFPAYVVVQFPDAVRFSDGNVSVPKLDAIATLGSRLLAEEPSIKSVEGPTNPQGSPVDYRNLSTMPPLQRSAILAAMSPYIGADNRTVRVLAVLVDPPFSRAAIHAIDRISATLADIRADDPELRAATVYLGGVSAILNDVRDTTNRDLQVMAVIVVIGLFLVLLFVLGSVLIPLRAVLTILLSIGWTLALTIVLFQIWKGLDVIFVLPLAMFVMAMGLGMDYDIFIITRVREEVAKGKTDREAILEAVTRTGGIISACGIVMAGAFATLMLSPLPFLQEIGFALAAVILIDSTVVRIYLVPAIMVLAGKYNWWAPGKLQRVRRDGTAARNPQESTSGGPGPRKD